jgi:hypothetical protein
MPFRATVYRVLIASPGDVLTDRDAVERAIIEWDDEHAHDRNAVFLPVRWERASPRGGAAGQEVINEDLVDTSDALIGIFWSRIGRKTKNDQSGSIEEIRRFAASGKPYGLFFKNAPLPMDHDRKQFASLVKFKDEVHSFDSELRGLSQDFESTEQLTRVVGPFLTNTLRRLEAIAIPDEAENRGQPDSIGSHLTPNVASVLRVAAVAAIDADDSRAILISKNQVPDLHTMSDAAFRSALEELSRRRLLTIKSDRGATGTYVDVTHDGLGRGLRLAGHEVNRAESRIRSDICRNAPTTIEEIAARLDLVPLLVRHVAENFSSQELLTVERFSDMTRVRKPLAELCGWERTRSRKACLVIGPHFPNKGDNLRQHFEVDLLNEGDYEAREIRAMWDVGDGFPTEELVAPLPYVIPPHTSGPESRYHAGFAVPWPDRNENGEPIQGQEREVRLKLTFRDGQDEPDEAIFTLRLRNVPTPNRWSAEELRDKARLSPICSASRMESR